MLERNKIIDPKKKGQKNGHCNRMACQSPDNVVWYNSGTGAYYCPNCAQMINNACYADLGYNLCSAEECK